MRAGVGGFCYEHILYACADDCRRVGNDYWYQEEKRALCGKDFCLLRAVSAVGSVLYCRQIGGEDRYGFFTWNGCKDSV